jgi:propanol-preferring alcohol dehydrogenase
VTMRTGVFGGEAPRVMGHELGGDIVAVGDGVTNVKPGDRCAVYFYLNCGYCRWCHGGRETLCENHGGYVGVHVDGGYADYVVLPAGNFLPIPEGLGYEDAAIAADAVNTNWHCMRERAKIAPHDDVLLIGAGGGVGVHGIQVAKAFGARVIAADISDEKLEFAKKWGADEVINVREVNDIAEAAKKLTDGRGVDAAVDYVGASETFTAAIEALATAGRAVLIGAKPSSVKIDPLDLLINEKTITGSRHSTRTELMETMDVMAKGTIKSAIGKRVHFTEVESLFEDLQAETLLGRGALTYDD